jgi:methionine-rich copper-binding protein CopC
MTRRLLLSLVAGAAILLPIAARAHAILVESQPAQGGTLREGHVDFRLRYNSRIDAERSRLTLTRPDHSQSVLPVSEGPREDLLMAGADLSPGTYSLRWQVLAVDGHITRGDLAFTVTGD